MKIIDKTIDNLIPDHGMQSNTVNIKQYLLPEDPTAAPGMQLELSAGIYLEFTPPSAVEVLGQKFTLTFSLCVIFLDATS